MAKVKETQKGEYKFNCPGCKTQHLVWTIPPQGFQAKWTFNENLESPTFAPSIKITYASEEAEVCHFFIKEGKIEYLSDCTHELAGKTIEMKDI